MSENFNHTRQTSSCTIFLADDDIDDQEFLQEALFAIDPHIQLISFSNGLKFMNRIAELDNCLLPNLIILDYNIPEINGEEILVQLNNDERFSRIPKIVWSTSDSQLFRKNCMASGAKAYMVKPSSVNGIQEIAKEMLTHC